MKEKTAFITGANKGIGFGIAKHLGLSGWRIIIGARNQERAEKAIRELTALDIDVPGWVCVELADLASVENAARELNDKHPELSLLVNNAGIPGDMGVDSLHTELSDIRETLDVNFVGTFSLTKLLMPLLAKNHGRAMMGVMAIEFQQHNTPLEIFSVHPGPTTTDLNGNMSLPGFHDIDTVGEKMAELINDGQSHQGEFVELYPIVKED